MILWITAAFGADLCVPMGFSPSGVTCTEYATLADAVTASGSGDTIWLESGARPDPPMFLDGIGPLVIRGESSADRPVFQATDGNNGMFRIRGSAQVVLQHLDIEALVGSRAVWVDNGELTLSDVEIRRDSPSVSTDQSALYVSSNGTLRMNQDSIVREWSSSTDGAQLYANGGVVRLEDANFEDGTSDGTRGGGAVYLSGNVDFDALRTRFRRARNTSGVGGGAVYVLDVTPRARFRECVFEDNVSNGSSGGGAIHVRNDGIEVSDSLFVGNRADPGGGAIRLNQGSQSTTIEDSVFRDNLATTGRGGAVQIVGGSVDSSRNVYESNEASEGGALGFAATSSSTDDLFCRNEAEDGGAIYTGGTTDVVGGVFIANEANGTAGALFQTSGTTDLRNNTFVNNRAGSPPVLAQLSSAGQIRDNAYLFHDGEALNDPGNGTWSNNAYLGNTDNFLGGAPVSLGVDNVTTGDPWIPPLPLCAREAVAPGSPLSVLLNASSVGDDIGAMQYDDTAVDADSDGWYGTADCEQADSTVFPGASALPFDGADGLDRDCDGFDECFVDDDGDGYGAGPGVPDITGSLCVDAGLSPTGDDCDDGRPNIHPGRALAPNDVGDNFDRDCDGNIECFENTDGDDFGSDVVINDDGDGVCDPSSFESLVDGDCIDVNFLIYPGAPEVCDSLDNDCDTEVDDADADVVGAPEWFADGDSDGFGGASIGLFCSLPAAASANDLDCDDANGNVFPGAPEACTDFLDNDCDGLVDADDPDFSAEVQYYFDGDGDGVGNPALSELACAGNQSAGYVPASTGDDCNDADPTISPLLNEACDGLDNDCDGLVDEDLGTIAVYFDADEDGFGDDAATLTVCVVPAGYVTTGGDCDDLEASVNPGAPEACNTQDDDCDGDVDEGYPIATYYEDVDSDGYGGLLSETSCAAPDGFVETPGDCDDLDASVNPAGTELCDGVDSDCDGIADEEDPSIPETQGYLDEDGDGFGGSVATARCGLIEQGGDCDDTNPDLNTVCVRVTGCRCDTPAAPGLLPLLGLVAFFRRRR